MDYRIYPVLFVELLCIFMPWVSAQNLNIKAVTRRPPAPLPPMIPPQRPLPPPPQRPLPPPPQRRVPYNPYPYQRYNQYRRPYVRPAPPPHAVDKMSDMEVMMMTSGATTPIGMFDQMLFKDGKLSNNAIPEAFRNMYNLISASQCGMSLRCFSPRCDRPTPIFGQESGCPECPKCPGVVLEEAIRSLIRTSNPIRLFAAQKISRSMSELPPGTRRRKRRMSPMNQLMRMMGMTPPRSPRRGMFGGLAGSQPSSFAPFAEMMAMGGGSNKFSALG